MLQEEKEVSYLTLESSLGRDGFPGHSGMEGNLASTGSSVQPVYITEHPVNRIYILDYSLLINREM